MRIIHIVGKRNHGKTTLVEALVRTLRDRGLTVGTIKHCGHPHDLDIPGKDSYRHQAAGAETTAVITPARMAFHQPRPDPAKTRDALETLFADCDIVLCEGWIDAEGIKIEVWREQAGGVPLAETHEDIVAVVTDDVPPVTRDVWPRSDVAFVAERILKLSRLETSQDSRTLKEEERMSGAVSPHDPLMMFVQGHDGVSEWVHNLDATVWLREEGESPVTFEQIRDYFHHNVREHFSFEEEVVFPALLALEPMPELKRLIRDLRIQHIEIVNDASKMFEELALVAANESASFSNAQDLVKPIVERILNHAAVEDHHLFPLLKAHREEIRNMIASDALPKRDA